MRLTKEIQPIIDRCCKFTRYSAISPELSCLCFDEGTITAYNGISGIIHLMGIDIQPMVVPASSVKELLNSLGELNLLSELGSISISSGKRFSSKFSNLLKSLPRWDFKVPTPDETELLPEKVFSGLQKVYFSVSTDETKADMRGVFCSGGYIYSTDNALMTRFPVDLGKIVDFFIPDNLLGYIIDEQRGPVGYSLDSTKIWFVFEDFVVFGQRFLGDFPNCKSVFESSKLTSEVKFDSTELGKVLDRFSFFVNSHPYLVDLVITPQGQLIVDAIASGIEFLTELVECETNVRDEIGFSVHINFLKKIVSKSNRFYVNDSFLHFFSDSGLESLLFKPLVVDPRGAISRVVKFI